MMSRIAAACLAGLLLVACQRDSDAPFVELSGRMFVFNYRVATAVYLVTLRKTGPFPKGAVAEATFENPRGGAPLVVRETLLPIMDSVSLTSPPLSCVRKDRPYAVTIHMLGSNGERIQTIETTITSDVDQSVLPAKPLVDGPFYTPNPKAFKADGTMAFTALDDCPT